MNPEQSLRQLPDAEQEPTISVPRAGRALGLGRGAAYNAAESGQIPTIRVGRRLLVPTAAVRQLVGLDQRDDEHHDPAQQRGR